MSAYTMIKLRISTFNKRWYCLALLFLIPLIILTGNFYINSPESNDRRLSIAVLDEDMTDLSRLVLERLYDNELLRVKQYEYPEEPQKALQRYDINAFFIIGKGFSDSVMSGYIDDSVILYHIPSDVTVQISAELFTKELMRVYISVLGVEYIKRIYGDYGQEFPAETEEEAYAYIERFWEGELTIPIIHKYAESRQAPRISLKAVITEGTMLFVLLLLLFFLASELTLQNERGVIKRLELCHVSTVKYYFTTALTDISVYMILISLVSAAVSRTKHFALGSGTWILLCLLLIWSAFMNAILARLIKRTADLLITAVVIALTLAFSGGVLFYMGGAEHFLSYAGYFNVVYCVMLGNYDLVKASVMLTVNAAAVGIFGWLFCKR